MTAIAKTPTNVNFLSPLGFKFQIKKAPNISFFVQSVTLPSLQAGNPNVPTPFIRMPLAGDHMEFGDFSITFKVDEDLESYLEIYNWMVGIGKPDAYEQYKQLSIKPDGEGIYSDLTLTILNSSMHAKHEVVMIDAFPTFLSELTFDSRMSDVDYVEATATFKFRKFNITTL